MNRRPLTRFLPVRLALLIAPLVAAWPQFSHAGSASWNANAAGTWTTATSWTPNTVPNGTADVATINNDITAARTINLASGTATNITVNDLNLGDANGSHGFTIASGVAGSTLIFGGTNPSLDIINGAAHTISAPVQFDASPVLRSQTTQQHVLSGGLRDGGTARLITFNNDTNGTARPPAIGEGQFSLTTTAATFNAGTTTVIDDVRVNVALAGVLGTNTNNSITVTGAGQLFVSGGTHVNSLVLNSTGWVESVGNLGAARLENGTVSGAVTLQQNTLLGNFANNVGTLSGPISGAFDITKVGGTTTAGQGVIQLSGNNAGWSGNLRVNRGTVRLSGSASQGTGSSILVDGSNVPVGTFSAGQLGAQLDLAGSGGSFGSGKTLTLKSGPLTLNYRATFLNQAGTNSWDAPITLESTEPGGSLIQISSNAAAGTTMTINGAVTASGTAYPGLLFFRGGQSGVLTPAATFNMPNTDWAKTDGGTWTIQSTGNVWRDTIAADGTVALGANDALDPTGNLVLGQTSGTTGQLDMAGFTQTVASFTSNPVSTSTGHILRNSSGAPSTLTFSTTALTDSFRGTLSSNVSLVKNGTGLFTLNSTTPSVVVPAWTGGTIQVNSGGFALTGSVTLGDTTTAVNIADGAVLAGEGALGGTLNLGTSTGSTLVVDGSSAGALTVNALTPAAAVQINSTSGFSPTGKTRIVNVPSAPAGLGTAAFSATGLNLRAPSFSYDSTVPAGVDLTYTSLGLRWNGTGGAVWDVGATASWQDSTPATMAAMNGDVLTLDDLPGADQSIAVTGMVQPGSITFDNSAAVKYTLTAGAAANIATPILKQNSGTLVVAYNNPSTQTATVTSGTLQLGNGGTEGVLSGNIDNSSALVFDYGTGASVTVPGAINGAGTITKNGAGTAIIAGTGTATGNTFVTAGVLEVDRDTGNLPSATTDIAAGATYRHTRNDAVITFDRTVTGAGTVELNSHSAAGGTAAHSSSITSTNPGFNGTWLLAAPVTGTWRVNAPATAALGNGSIDVRSGAQLLAAAATYTNNITIAGIGFTDASANIGALRIEGATWNGNITVAPGGARIGAHNGTGTIGGNITGGPVEFNVSNYNNNYTIILTGANSYTDTIVGGGNTQTAGVPSQRVNVGNGGTTGSLGTGPVTINGGGANGVLGFDRSDAYTLAPGQTVTAAGTNLARTFIDFDTTGLGFSSGGNAITLGTPAAGGSLRVAQSRAGASATFDAPVSAAQFLIGAVQPGTVTLNSGADVSVANLSIAATAATANGSILNINTGASLTAAGPDVGIGNQSGSAATVNQSGGSVTAGTATTACRFRLAHWPNETSAYNLTGGSLSLIGPAPATTPSIAGNPEIAGGVCVGVDGTGIFNQSGTSTVTAHFVLLDARGAAVANATAGEDQYNLTGGTLNLTSPWGIIARHPLSSKFTLDGGTIANAAPAGTAVLIDAPLAAGASGGTLATGDAASSFVLTGSITGTGSTLATTGGGKLTLHPNSKAVLDGVSDGLGSLTIEPGISGNASVEKTGTGSATLAGASTYSGSTTISAGLLTVNGSLTSATIVKSGATLAGTGNAGAITAESSSVVTPGAGVATLSGSSADLQSGSRLDIEITGAATADKLSLTGALTAAGTIKVTLTGYVPVAGDSFDIADASSSTGTPVFDFAAAPLTPGLNWDTSAFATTGVISVQSADPYGAWATANGVTGGKNGDDDKDGATNLLEFATNSVPVTGAGSGGGANAYPKLAPLGGDQVLTLTIAVRKNAVFAADGATQKATQDGVIYTVQGTSDLTTWDSVITKLNPADSTAVQATLSLPPLGTDWEWHTFRTDDGVTGDPRDYIRLSVTATP